MKIVCIDEKGRVIQTSGAYRCVLKYVVKHMLIFHKIAYLHLSILRSPFLDSPSITMT